MADSRLSPSAARLSEDIGDVLTAIRRMIAEDEALSSARERLMAERDMLDSLIQEDAGEFLARRYGGNAALARRLAGANAVPEPTVAEDDVADAWPLGDAANASDAVRPGNVLRHPGLAASPTVARPEPQAEPEITPAPRNDLARTLSAGFLPRISDEAESAGPLRLEIGREPLTEAEEAPKRAGWRSWLRAEPRAAMPLVAEATVEIAEDPGKVFAALVEEEDAFAEAFDWKSRMRPDLAVAVAPVPEMALAEEATAEVLSEEEAPDVNAVGESETNIVAANDGFAPFIAADAAVAAAPLVEPVPFDTITGLSPSDEEASIRELLREMVQEELQGELGERFSSNLRAVIRREVAAAIDAHLDRY